MDYSLISYSTTFTRFPQSTIIPTPHSPVLPSLHRRPSFGCVAEDFYSPFVCYSVSDAFGSGGDL